MTEYEFFDSTPMEDERLDAIEDLVAAFLRLLTARIQDLRPELLISGFLGGSLGYGADFENDVFMMHRYCWCERDDCPWCNAGEDVTGAPNFIHKRTGISVHWYKYIGRGMQVHIPDGLSVFDVAEAFKECHGSVEG